MTRVPDFVGPVVAAAAIVVIMAFMRWTFSQKTRRDPFADQDTTGLLRVVAVVPRREQALALRAVLSDAGIRSTIRGSRDGGVQVLVFPDDVPAARLLAGPHAP